MKIWIVYCIKNTANGKQYIGITSQGLRRRWMAHVSAALRKHADTALARSIRLHGAASFSVSTIVEAVDFREASVIERAVIAERGCLVKAGYNMTTGGEATFGRRVSPESRAKMSASASARPRWKDSDEVRARKSAARKLMMTPELRAKIGAAQRGKIVSDETVARWRRTYARNLGARAHLIPAAPLMRPRA